MVRVVLFLLLLAALAFGAAWIADQPGTVSVLWLGRQIEFEVLTGIVGLLVAAAAAMSMAGAADTAAGACAAVRWADATASTATLSASISVFSGARSTAGGCCEPWPAGAAGRRSTAARRVSRPARAASSASIRRVSGARSTVGAVDGAGRAAIWRT